MSEEKKTEQKVAESSAPTGADTAAASSKGAGATGGARRTFGKKPGGFRKSSRFRSERPKPEFDQKIINISRVTRVVKGGRRLSFRVDMVIGDKKGRVGLGSGKATDTSLAIQKAFNQARKNLIKLKLTKTFSIPYAVSAKVTSSEVEMMPNKERGLVAGSTMRTVLELAGINHISGRIHSRSKNKLNNAKATIEALKTFAVKMAPVEEKTREEKKEGRFNNRNGRNGADRRVPSRR